jgi:hypothetical protein
MTTLSEQYFDVSSMSTPFSPQGDYKISTLAPLNVDCNGQGMVQFILGRDSPPEGVPVSQIRYNYTCSKDLNLGNPSTKKTNLGSNVKTTDLTQQNVTCEGKPLTQFQLQNTDATHAQYSYQCANLPLMDIKKYATNWQDVGSWESVFLDRQDVKCPQGEMMTSFRLKELPTEEALKINTGFKNGAISYEYECGKLPNVEPPVTPWYKTTTFYIILVIVIVLLLCLSSASVYASRK